MKIEPVAIIRHWGDPSFDERWMVEPPEWGSEYQVIREEWNDDLTERTIWEIRMAGAVKVEPEPIILQPGAVKARFFDLYRGGLPSSSVPGGSRSREIPMPMLDLFDRQLRAMARYLSWTRISEATSSTARRQTAIDNAYRIQTWFLLRPDPIEDVMCDDKSCTNLLELGRKSGRCQSCKMRESRKRKRNA